MERLKCELTALSLPRAQVRPLIGELRSRKLCAKRKKRDECQDKTGKHSPGDQHSASHVVRAQ